MSIVICCLRIQREFKMPGNRSFKAKHRRKIKSLRMNKKSVLKMRSILPTPQENSTADFTFFTPIEGHMSEKFLTTGRTGRRNALPDIMASVKTTSTADLPTRLEGLTTSDNPETSTNIETKVQDCSSSSQHLSTSNCSSTDKHELSRS